MPDIERFDHHVLDRAWSPGQPPATLDRSGRVKLLGAFAEAALSGKPPSHEGMLFVAGAIQAWLTNGGDLERDFLKVTGLPGSHHTAAFMWQQLSEGSSGGAQDLDDEDTISPSFNEGES